MTILASLLFISRTLKITILSYTVHEQCHTFSHSQTCLMGMAPVPFVSIQPARNTVNDHEQVRCSTSLIAFIYCKQECQCKRVQPLCPSMTLKLLTSSICFTYWLVNTTIITTLKQNATTLRDFSLCMQLIIKKSSVHFWLLYAQLGTNKKYH